MKKKREFGLSASSTSGARTQLVPRLTTEPWLSSSIPSILNTGRNELSSLWSSCAVIRFKRLARQVFRLKESAKDLEVWEEGQDWAPGPETVDPQMLRMATDGSHTHTHTHTHTPSRHQETYPDTRVPIDDAVLPPKNRWLIVGMQRSNS
jgi:hypothetical protein